MVDRYCLWINSIYTPSTIYLNDHGIVNKEQKLFTDSFDQSVSDSIVVGRFLDIWNLEMRRQIWHTLSTQLVN